MVDLIGVKDGVLKVRGLDAFDGTPVIDIKVYLAEIDCAREG
jgi:tRNA (Thr-GGU) A37 N-methylase